MAKTKNAQTDATTENTDEQVSVAEVENSEPESQDEYQQSEEEIALGVARTEYKLDGSNKGVDPKFDGQIVHMRIVGDTEDAEQAMRAMLSLTGGSVLAVVDRFNAGYRIDAQKAIKDAAAEGAEDNAPQTVADTYVSTPNTKGRGGSKEKASTSAKAKAAKYDAINSAAEKAKQDLAGLRESNPTMYEMQRQVMLTLGFITEEEFPAL